VPVRITGLVGCLTVGGDCRRHSGPGGGVSARDPEGAQGGRQLGGLARSEAGEPERGLVECLGRLTHHRLPGRRDRGQDDAPVIGGQSPLDQTALFQPGDGVGHRRRVHHQPFAHLAHRQRSPAAEGQQAQCLVGGEGQAVWLERVLDPAQQQLLGPHHRRDGGHAVRLFRPACAPLPVRLGNGVERLMIRHAAYRTLGGRGRLRP